jgi:hypothetical protein
MEELSLLLFASDSVESSAEAGYEAHEVVHEFFF